MLLLKVLILNLSQVYMNGNRMILGYHWIHVWLLVYETIPYFTHTSTPLCCFQEFLILSLPHAHMNGNEIILGYQTIFWAHNILDFSVIIFSLSQVHMHKNRMILGYHMVFFRIIAYETSVNSYSWSSPFKLNRMVLGYGAICVRAYSICDYFIFYSYFHWIVLLSRSSNS